MGHHESDTGIGKADIGRPMRVRHPNLFGGRYAIAQIIKRRAGKRNAADKGTMTRSEKTVCETQLSRSQGEYLAARFGRIDI